MQFDISCVDKAFKASSSDSRTATYALVKKGSMVWKQTYACHGYLKNDDNIKSSDFVISRLYARKANVDQYTDDFINWMVNDSHWSGIHLRKDVEDIKNYGWIFGLDGDATLTGSALIASRHLTERPHQGEAWGRFRAMGFTGTEAFLLSNMYTYNDKKWSESWYDGDQACFRFDLSNATLPAGFLKNRPNLAGMSFKENCGYGQPGTNNIVLMWEQKEGKHETLKRVTSSFVPPSKRKANDYNIKIFFIT